MEAKDFLHVAGWWVMEEVMCRSEYAAHSGDECGIGESIREYGAVMVGVSRTLLLDGGEGATSILCKQQYLHNRMGFDQVRAKSFFCSATTVPLGAFGQENI